MISPVSSLPIRPGPLGVLTAGRPTRQTVCLVDLSNGPGTKGCLRYALTACWLGSSSDSAPSLIRLREWGAALVRPVPLPRRLPTAGDRLSCVINSFHRGTGRVEKKFSSVKFHGLFDHLGDECEPRQEWRPPSTVPCFPLCDMDGFPTRSPAGLGVELQLQPFSGGSLLLVYVL